MSRKAKGAPAEYQHEPSPATLFETPAKWEDHWKDMPEFVQVKQREYAKLVIRFRNQEDLEAFAVLIGQKLNKTSQCTWYPELVKSDALVYVDES